MTPLTPLIPGVAYYSRGSDPDWHAAGRPDATVDVGLRRAAADHPFAADVHWNVSIGSGATYGTSTDPEYAVEGILAVDGSPYTGRPYGGLRAAQAMTVNSATYTVAGNKASESDTTITVTVTSGGDYPPSIGPVWTGKAPTPVLLSAEWNLAGVNPDSECVIIEPDGRTAHEFYKLLPVAGTTRQYTATRHRVIDLQGDGYASYDVSKSSNIRAARFPISAGLERVGEMLSTDVDAFAHRAVLALPPTCLLRRSADPSGKQFIWPAAGVDSFANDPLKGYFGRIPMGALFAIPSSVTMPAGLTLDGQKLFKQLQDYGAVVGDVSGFGVIYVTYGLSNAAVAALKADWQGTAPLITIVGNPTGGTFVLSSGGNTATLAWNASAATVQTAIRAWAGAYANVLVTGSNGGPYRVTFPAVATNTPATVPAFSVDQTGLTGGTAASSSATVVVSKMDGLAGLLRLVTNTSPTNPGGPGTPRRDPAPAFI